jgi:4-hydroxyphenylpyruvate dioxygenase
MAPSMISPSTSNDIFPSKLGPEYVGFDHITWLVGNAKQAASYYVTRMGFNQIAYRGAETGSRYEASYVVSNGKATFVLTSPFRGPPEYGPNGDDDLTSEEKASLKKMHDHLAKHGDGVKDVAFQIDGGLEGVWQRAVARGARVISEPKTISGKDGKDGGILMATMGTYGETTHTLIDRNKFSGAFLPGFVATTGDDPVNKFLPKIDFIEIDHCVGNQPWDGLDSAVKL